MMKSVPTYMATISVGSKDETDTFQLTAKALNAIQAYVNEVGLCVSVTETQFIYTGGHEPGLLIGLINYPRFPSTPADIKKHALVIAELVKDRLHQKRVSIILSDETITIGEL